MEIDDRKSQAIKGRSLNGRDKFHTQGLVILIIAFFLAYVPLLPSTARYRGDEALYTSAAIRMVQTGDYFTPYYYNGNLRLQKPIFIYWVMAASYKVFGVNLFGSRIPFLIAGSVIIWLTYKLSLLFFRRKEWAFIAAAVIASNLTLFHVSVRSTTDTLLCLFISMSLYGFASLMFNRDQKTINYILAYGGAGLAAATKGGWGVLPVAFAFLYCLLLKRDTIRLRELIDIKSIAIAVLVAAFWYVIAYYRHGDLFVQHFFGDQVGERFSGAKWYIIGNIFAYLAAGVRDFLPWSFILILLSVIGRRRDMIAHWFHEHKEACIFMLGWFISLCVVFAFGNIQRTRFLFPAYPLLAAFYAALLVPLVDHGKGLSSSVLRYLEWITLATCVLFGLALAVGGMFIDTRLIGGGLLALFAAAILFATLFRRRGIYSLVTISLCIILLSSISENFVSRVIYNSPAPHAVRTIRKHVKGPIEIAAVDLSGWYVAQIYVLSGGHITVKMLEPDTSLDKLKQSPFIVLSESSKETFDLDGFSVQECGYSYKRIPFKIRYLRGIRTISDLRSLISGLQQPYYLLIKSESPQR